MLRSKFKVSHLKQKGFTIVELMVVAPVVILTIGAFVTVVIGLTGDVLASRASNVALYNIQDGLNRVEQDIKLSSSFLATNNITPQTGQGFDDGTAGFKNVSTTNGPMLILNSIATTGNPLQTGSGYVYAIDPLNACNSPQVIQNLPQSMNIIYFLKAGTLWRRVVMQQNYANTTTNWCTVPWQEPSCTPGYVAPFCKTQDIQIVSGLGTSGFTVQYYNGGSASIENTAASDTTATDANRAAALTSSTTATISLTSNQTIAGRTVSQAGTIRATRLDINASSIYVPPTPVTPTAPVVSANLTGQNNPTTATFTWPSVSGATSYTVNYSINGGTYVNGSTGTNINSYSVVGIRNKSICVTVYAVNSAGTSPFGSACITIPLWTTLLLQNGWGDYGSPFSTAAWTQTSDGMIILKGLIKGGTIGQTIATLPAGYRPVANIMRQNIANNAAGRVDIYPNGVISPQVGNNSFFSLDGFAFMPTTTDGTNSMPTTINYTALASFSNGWNNFSPGSGNLGWQQAGYYQDNSGRVHFEGLVYGGTATDGTTILSYPSALSPSGYEHVSNDNSNAVGLIGNNTNGTVAAKGGGNSYLSFSSVFYPSTYSGWTTLSLTNSWSYYGSPFSTPRYVKSADGAVLLKGLIHSGTTGVNVALLPAGYCPKQELLLATVAAGAISRVDIGADPTGTAGCGVNGLIDSATWTSLDSIVFYPG